MIDHVKKEFLKSEAWALTLGGGFGRANVYKDDNTDDINRVYFKNKLRGYLDHLSSTDYKIGRLSDLDHINNIKGLQDFTCNFNELLNNGQLNFGVCQKLLNLHLKYHWCLGFIPEPPHFPVDRIIQQRLKIKPIISWTKMESEEEYLNVINIARTILEKNNNGFKSLPELELNVFSRRNQ